MKNTGLYRVLNSVFEAYNAEGWSDGETNADDLSLTTSLSKNLSKKMVGGSLVFDFEDPKNIPDIWTKNIPSFLYWLNGPDGQKYWSSFYKYMSQSTSLKWSSNWHELMNSYNGKYFSESSSLRIMWSNFEWFMIFLYTTFFIPRGVRFTKTYIINALKDGFGDDFNMLYFDNRVRTLGDIEYLLPHGDGVKVKDVSDRLTATSQGVLYQLVLGLTEDIYKHFTGDTYNSRPYSPNHNFIHQVLDWLEDMSGIMGPDFLKLIDIDDVPESDNYYVSNCIADTTNNLMQWARQSFPE